MANVTILTARISVFVRNFKTFGFSYDIPIIMQAYYILKLLKKQRHVMFNPFSVGTVFIRQILTYKDGPRAESINIFVMAVNP